MPKSTKTSLNRSQSKSRPAAQKPVAAKVGAKGKSLLSLSLLDVKGATVGEFALPATWFGVKPINKQLVAQAVRVYLANQRSGTAATKTRGQVTGSTRKIYRQKGTGRARHGGIRAPIFVGGGVAFGPTPRDFSLVLPQKMRQRALASALTWAFSENRIRVISGLESLEPKTKLFAATLAAYQINKRALLVVPRDSLGIKRGAKNLALTDIKDAESLTTFDVVSHQFVVFSQPAVERICAKI